MDEREQQRRIRHRLAVLRHADAVSGSVAATCRYYGISRPTFYKWRNRYEELGEEGLSDSPIRSGQFPRLMRLGLGWGEGVGDEGLDDGAEGLFVGGALF